MDQLILFAKNPIQGKVKTRIAGKIGEDGALEVYKFLLNQALNLLAGLPENIDPVVYFSDHREELSLENRGRFRMEIQHGADLGQRMSNAIENELNLGSNKVCIIGSDIYELKQSIILEAFEKLTEKPIILGPAKDGGYYLIGMTMYYPELFTGIEWGNSNVFKETISKIESLNISYGLLPVLADVDDYENIPMEILSKLDLF